MLKRVKYSCHGRSGEVVYLVIDHCCYFSLTNPTIMNRAEVEKAIIKEISRAEKVEVHHWRWFNLQTHCSHEKSIGEYELDELGFSLPDDGDWNIVFWSMTKCPPEVLEAFHEFIYK